MSMGSGALAMVWEGGKVQGPLGMGPAGGGGTGVGVALKGRWMGGNIHRAHPLPPPESGQPILQFFCHGSHCPLPLQTPSSIPDKESTGPTFLFHPSVLPIPPPGNGKPIPQFFRVPSPHAVFYFTTGPYEIFDFSQRDPYSGSGWRSLVQIQLRLRPHSSGR